MSDTPQIFRVRELELRYKPQRLDAPFEGQVSDPPAAAKLAAHLLRDAATEVALALHLNARHRLIGVHRTQGSGEGVHVSVPAILKAALLSNARAVVFAHNHLAGDPQPSAKDREVLQRLRNALRLLGLDLFDAAIVIDRRRRRFLSFREQCLL